MRQFGKVIFGSIKGDDSSDGTETLGKWNLEGNWECGILTFVLEISEFE